MNYWRNLSLVLMGTITAQILPVIGSLILVRQFFPTEFGLYSVWLGVTIFISICLTGRFETSLPMEEDGQYRMSAVIYVLVTILITSLLPFFALILIYLIDIQSIGLLPLNLLIISFLASLLMSFSQTWQTWAAAEGFYKKLSIMRIFQAGLIVTFQVVMGFIKPDVFGLVFGHFFGLILSLLICMSLMPVKLNFGPSNLKFELLAFWKKNRKFPLFSLPADAINTAAGQLPLLLIASRFGADIAGYYAITTKVLGAPIGLLGSSALDVFKKHAASAYRKKGECRTEYMHTFKILSIATVLTSILFFFSAEKIFLVAYGQDWAMSGKIAIWLIPLFALRFVASPLSYMVYIAGKQHFDLLWQTSLLGITFFSLAFAPGFEEGIKLYSLGYAFLYLIYIYMSYRFSFLRSK